MRAAGTLDRAVTSETTETADITRWLVEHGAGDEAAFHRLVPVIYDELKAIARRQLRRTGSDDTLDTTALVHEAYDHLVAERGVEFQDRRHFFAIAARTMRRILVDHFRQRSAQKRWGGLQRVDLDHAEIALERDGDVVLAVDRALETLEGIDPRLARLVEYRFFCGCTEDETAEVLGVSRRTVQRDWLRARAWLRAELADAVSH